MRGGGIVKTRVTNSHKHPVEPKGSCCTIPQSRLRRASSLYTREPEVSRTTKSLPNVSFGRDFFMLSKQSRGGQIAFPASAGFGLFGETIQNHIVLNVGFQLPQLPQVVDVGQAGRLEVAQVPDGVGVDSIGPADGRGHHLGGGVALHQVQQVSE